MANIRAVRRRIRSVRSTAKITKAMEMIAASKMRRAQESSIAGRPYAQKISQVLADLAAQPTERVLHPLLQRRSVNRIAIVHITPERGLCGGLNSNINRMTGSFIVGQSVPVTLITVGRRGRDFMIRHGLDIRADFRGIGDQPTIMDVRPISHIVIEDYSNGMVDLVYLAYTRFHNTMVQSPVLQQLLPIEPASLPAAQNVEYIFEPGATIVLAELLPRFVEREVYHAVLESIASEHSARMVAMRNATDNANELIQHLTLVYNKVRQELITKELLDIIGGVSALG